VTMAIEAIFINIRNLLLEWSGQLIFFRLKQGIIELKAAGLSFSLAESVSSNHSLDCYGR
jgi:hypothetical protein